MKMVLPSTLLLSNTLILNSWKYPTLNHLSSVFFSFPVVIDLVKVYRALYWSWLDCQQFCDFVLMWFMRLYRCHFYVFFNCELEIIVLLADAHCGWLACFHHKRFELYPMPQSHISSMSKEMSKCLKQTADKQSNICFIYLYSHFPTARSLVGSSERVLWDMETVYIWCTRSHVPGQTTEGSLGKGWCWELAMTFPRLEGPH